MLGLSSLSRLSLSLSPATASVAPIGTARLNIAQGPEVPAQLQAAAGAKTRIKMRADFIAREAATSIRLRFANRYIALTTGESNGTGAIDIRKYAVVLNGVVYPVLFSGARTATVAIGATAFESDDLAIALNAGDRISLRGSADVPNGWVCHGNLPIVGDGNDQCFLYDPANEVDDVDATGVMSTPTGATAAANRGFGYFPYAITAMVPSQKDYFLLAGDSIETDRNDTISLSNADGTFARRAVRPLLRPYIGCSLVGRTIAEANLAHSLLDAVRAVCTHEITDLGTNDLAGSSNYAAAIAAKRTCWAAAKGALGGRKRVTQTKITPRVTTTDGLTSLAGQTPLTRFLPGADRDQLNAQMAADVGSYGLFAFVDTSSPIEEPTDRSKFAIRGYTSTLAAAATANTLTISVNAPAPVQGELLVADPVGPNKSSGRAIVNSVAGTGPYTVTLNAALAVAQLSGAVLRGSPAFDGTHGSPFEHAAMGVPLHVMLAANP